MAKLGNRSLSSLARIFGLGGDNRISDIDTGIPAQPVVDISRLANYGSGYGRNLGFVILQCHNAHLAGQIKFCQLDPYEVLTTPGIGFDAQIPQKTELMVWLLGWNVWSAVDDLSYDYFGIKFLTTTGLIQSFIQTGTGFGFNSYIALHRGDGTLFTDIYSGTGSTSYFCFDNQLTTPPAIRLPFPLPVGSLFEFESQTTSAMDVLAEAYCWVGPKGATPPGAG